MRNKIFFFSDIDDTLIQTRRKTDFKKKVVAGAYKENGEENSFFYEGTKLLIDTLLKAGITFIPTTARNFKSYKRTIFFNQNHKYSILNFGATILENNIESLEWKNNIYLKYSKIEKINTIEKIILIDLSNIKLSIKTVDNFYISIYNKYSLDNEKILFEIREKLNNILKIKINFYLYENGNSFAILPNFLNKKFAVEFIIEKKKPILTIGAGDNISDLAFMENRDFLLIPKDAFKNLRQKI